MHPRTRLVYFYFLRVIFLLKTSTSGRCDQVRLPWQRYICRSKYGCFCLSPQVTYLHTKIEGGLNFFISNFASLSRRIALNEIFDASPISTTTVVENPFEALINYFTPQKNREFEICVFRQSKQESLENHSNSHQFKTISTHL